MNVFGNILESACPPVSVSMCPSVYLSVYKILVILFCKLLQFGSNCIETLHIYIDHIEILEDTVLKCQLLLVEELSSLELF